MLLLCAAILPCWANPGLTECYSLSEKNYPAARQLKQESDISQRALDNYDAQYYPQMKLLGQAQYQSDVTKIELDLDLPNFTMPELPSMPKDQYKFGLSVNQLIWDGGLISDSKELEKINLKVNSQNVNTQIYSVKSKINDAYFAILTIDASVKSLELLTDDLNAKLEKVKVAVANGAALPSSAQMIEAEILKTNQSVIKLKSKKAAAFGVLEELTGVKFDSGTGLAVPEAEGPDGRQIPEARPEYTSFSLASEQLDRYMNLTDAKYMPKISAYGQAMYARPGLNMFDSDWQPYYIVGIQASWEFWSWGTKDREKEILALKKEIVNTSKSTFAMNQKIGAGQLAEDIGNYGELLQKDLEIIALKKEIAAAVSSQLDNGVITASEYLTEVKSEAIARLSYEIHKLELLQAKVNYLTATGETDKIK